MIGKLRIERMGRLRNICVLHLCNICAKNAPLIAVSPMCNPCPIATTKRVCLSSPRFIRQTNKSLLKGRNKY